MREPSFDDLMRGQPEEEVFDAGIHTQLINSLPRNPSEPFVIVGMDKKVGRVLRPFIVEARGENYMKWVVISAVHDIHKWGAGIWSDRFYFMREVIENLDKLAPNDQTFIRMLITPAGMAEILQIRSQDIKVSWWKRLVHWLKRKWKKVLNLLR